MRVPASWFRVLHYPHRCEKRLRLHFQGLPAAPPGPFDEILIELGRRHERRHLATLPEFVDLSLVSQRFEQTREELQQHRAILYQPFLQATLAGVQLVGSPDFMLPTSGGWTIRDAKLAQDIDHPEIIGQLNFYGLLYEQVQGEPPAALELVLGTGDIVTTPYLGQEQVIGQIRGLLRVVAHEGAYEPVGWSKCSGCGYRDLCWPRAMQQQDVATLLDVDQGLARLLHERGCRTIADLLRDYDLDTLAEISRPWGMTVKKVGSRAASILNHARAISENRVVVLKAPHLPDASNFVMFDLEGLPPHIDEQEKVVLWGLKVFGDRPSPFRYSCAFPGLADDEEAWLGFLELAQGLFNNYGDIPFVHWAAYERSKLRLYVERYGDRNEIAARVRTNLFDLLRVMSKSVCLPLPTRSLKEVEKFVGFERQLPGRGDWAVSQYLRAAETGDRNLLNELLAYNEEDLDATWAVYRWLREQLP